MPVEFEERSHPFLYLVEQLSDDPSFIERRMFGCLAVYYGGKMQLVLAAQGESPWMGILIPTEREYHSSLVADFPALASHPVLGKWLYIAESTTEFEPTIAEIVKLIARGDERVGILPKPRKRKKQLAKQKKKSSR